MEYLISLELPDRVETEVAAVETVVAAYDLCRELLTQTPEAIAAHLSVNGVRIHTMKQRR